MGRRFRIHSTRNLNLPVFVILFHFQISGESATFCRKHVVILVNNRNNVLACNNRLVIATFNKIERHSPRCYVDRCFGTRIVINTSD